MLIKRNFEWPIRAKGSEELLGGSSDANRFIDGEGDRLSHFATHAMLVIFRLPLVFCLSILEYAIIPVLTTQVMAGNSLRIAELFVDGFDSASSQERERASSQYIENIGTGRLNLSPV